MTVTPPVADETRASEPIESSGAPLSPELLEPVQYWSEVDPNYEDIIPVGDLDEDLDEDDLTEGELEPPETDVELLPFWASYELHGRNLDEGSPWAQLATADFDGDLEVEVEGLTAGARWEFRIRLIDQNGRHSKWSEPLQITLPTDFTPPPAPTAPGVENVNGYTAASWDGLLQGATPEDLSHAKLYVQQMHPPGDPSGAPGDPRPITNFYSAGEAPVMQFLANVLHRAFLTALDTTGNESPWSPTVEFTPTPPVDEEAIQRRLDDAQALLEEAREDFEAGNEARIADIEHLNDTVLPGIQATLNAAIAQQREALEGFQEEWDANWDPEAMDDLRSRQETLEGDLVTGLDNAYDQAQQLAQQAEDNAVGRAASDAQSEYDRLQAIANEALEEARRRGMEEGFESAAWDDPDFRAARNGFQTNAAHLARYSRSTFAHHGNYSLWSNGHANSGRLVVLDWWPVRPGQIWRVSAALSRTSIATSSGSGANHKLTLRDQTGAEVMAYQPINTLPGNGNVWTYQEDDLIIPDDGSVTEVRLELWTDHTQGRVAIDSVRAADITAGHEAIALAEEARRRADAAHIAAGNARDLAVTAQDTAAGKADIIRSTTTPTGTAPEGSIWFRYNNMTANRRLIGWWVRESGAWRSQEMDETILPQVNIGTGTYGDLEGDRLSAQSVDADYALVRNSLKARSVDMEEFTASRGFLDSAMVNLIQGRMANFDQALIGNVLLKDGAVSLEKLLVADTQNYLTDEHLYIFRDKGASAPPWTGGGWTTILNQSYMPIALRWNGGGNHRLTFRGNNGLGIPVRPGEKWRLDWYGWLAGTTGGAPYLRARYDDANGSYVAFGPRHNFSTGWNRDYYEWTVPNDNAVRYMQICFEGVGTEASGSANRGHWGDFELMKQTLGVHIGDGEITAPKVNVQEFFADSGVINNLSVSIARAMEITAERGFIGGALLEDDSITVAKLNVTDSMAAQLFSAMEARIGNLAFNTASGMEFSAGQITTGELTGRTVQTSSNWETSGGAVMRQGGTHGNFVAVDSDGNVTARLGGDRNELRGVYVQGELFAGPTSSAGVSINYGLLEVAASWTDEGDPDEIVTSRVTPYMEFHDSAITQQRKPSLWLDEDGRLNIFAGFSLGSSSDARMWGRFHANGLIARRLEIPTGSPAQPGGMRRDGPRTRLLGRTPAQSSATDMYSSTQLGPYNMGTGGRYRGGSSWAYPPPQGSRPVLVSGRVETSRTQDTWEGVRASAALPPSGNSAEGYRFTLLYDGTSNWNAWLQVLARWE